MSFSLRLRASTLDQKKVRAAVAADPRLTKYMYKTGHRVERIAKKLVHSRTGALRKSIHTDIVYRKGVPVARVGSSLSYARVHHFGARPHTIRAKRGGYMVFTYRGHTTKAKVVNHPGHKPNRYLLNALHKARVRTT